MNENQNEYVDINAHDNYPDSKQKIEIPTMKVIPLKKICMTIGELPTSYLETMTYYEMLIWFINFLRDNIIPTVNGNGEAVKELQNVVMSLQNYINEYKDSIDSDVEELEEYMNNYFENLDVQEEINNKLDKMLEDGVLSEIIQQFLQSTAIWGFDTLTDLQEATNLIDGSFARTLGYYSLNDGGGALYKITDIESQTEYQETLSNNLYATLIIEDDTINFKQLGAKSDDNTFDNKNYLLKYQTICNTLDKQIKLIIPNGTWYFSPTHLSRIGGFNIEGIGGYSARTFVAPVICAINTQDYIWKFGGLEDMGNTTIPYANANTGNNIKNLVFSTKEYSINYGCLVLEYANYGFYDKLLFNNIIGTGLYIRSSWENYFGMMNFRAIKDFSKPCFKVATIRGISTVSPNVSSSSFDKMIFESISGDLIGLELGCSFVNNQIGEINVEYGYSSLEGETSTVINSETDLSEMIPIFLINGNGSGITIDTINWTGLSSYNYYHTTPNGNYYFKSLFNSIGGGSTEGYRYDFNIGKISTRSVLQILTSIEPYAPGMCFSLGNYIETSANSNIDINYFDLKNSGKIHYDSIKSRLKNIDKLPLNTIKISQNGQGGTLNTDDGALGNKICCSKSSGGAITSLGFTYPYEYSDTKKLKALLRLKTTNEGGYYFVLRGLHNGSNVNTTYSASNLEPNSWITIPIEMNYDFNSEIRTVSQNCLLDTLTFIGYE